MKSSSNIRMEIIKELSFIPDKMLGLIKKHIESIEKELHLPPKNKHSLGCEQK